MNLGIAITLALISSPDADVGTSASAEPAPRVSVTASDREVVSRSGVLGLLEELDGASARLVFSVDAVDAALDALVSTLSSPNPVNTVRLAHDGLAQEAKSATVEIGGIYDSGPGAWTRSAHRRPATLALNDR